MVQSAKRRSTDLNVTGLHPPTATRYDTCNFTMGAIPKKLNQLSGLLLSYSFDRNKLDLTGQGAM